MQLTRRCVAFGICAATVACAVTACSSGSHRSIRVLAHRAAHQATRTVVPPTEVTPAFFGMHVLHPEAGWPAIPVGAYRLWDDHTTWRDLEPSRGTWVWTQLDTAVTGARARGAPVELVLGQTPAWASSLRTQPGLYGDGAAAPPARMSDWTDYVRAVASRYRGRIEAYEIWNEPNWEGEYYGSPQRLAALTTAAARVIKSVDPHALVVSPSFVVSDRFDNAWLNRFLSTGGATLTDIIAIHGYPTVRGAPEQAEPYMTNVFRALDLHHVTQPVWDTEYNLRRTGSGPMPPDIARAMLVRSYVLAASYGVARLYWYAWRDNHFGAVELSTASGRPTAVAPAYRAVRQWLMGARSQGCRHQRAVWVCEFTRSATRMAAAWSTNGQGEFRVEPPYRVLHRIGAHNLGVSTGQLIPLSRTPVWFTS